MTNSLANPQRSVARIDFLEGLRGFLAVYVMFAHIGYFVGLSRIDKQNDVLFPGVVPLVLNWFDLSGWDAVNMFMILSGFVIFHLLSKGRETYAAYIIRRFFRLWPVFIICIIFGVITNPHYVTILRDNPWSHNSWIEKQLNIATVIQQNVVPYFLFDLPMIHGMVPDFVLLHPGSAFSSLAWCISTEWQYYLCAAFFFRLMKNSIGTAILTAFVIFSIVWPQVYSFSVNPNGSLLPLQLHWFFLGMICYLAYQDIEANGLNNRNRLKIVFAVVFTLGISLYNWRLAPAALAWLFVLATLVSSLTRKPNFVSRMVTGFFDHKVTRYFGRISYPVYLVHWPVSILVIWALVKFYPQSSWQVAYLILIIAVPAVTWPVAHLIHHYLEKPMMEFGKRVAAKFPRPEAAVLAPAPQPVVSNTNQPA